MTNSIAQAIRSVLETADPAAKVKRARAAVRDWRAGWLAHAFDVAMPDRPARPPEPVLLSHNRMPRRVTPATIERFAAADDTPTARILDRILRDEIRHVAYGATWFNRACKELNLTPESHWRALVARHFRGAFKPPFNDSAREAAGLTRDFYASIA